MPLRSAVKEIQAVYSIFLCVPLKSSGIHAHLRHGLRIPLGFYSSAKTDSAILFPVIIYQNFADPDFLLFLQPDILPDSGAVRKPESLLSKAALIPFKRIQNLHGQRIPSACLKPPQADTAGRIKVHRTANFLLIQPYLRNSRYSSQYQLNPRFLFHGNLRLHPGCPSLLSPVTPKRRGLMQRIVIGQKFFPKSPQRLPGTGNLDSLVKGMPAGKIPFLLFPRFQRIHGKFPHAV